MWERQHDHARWNGLKLNIQSTSLDGGKRLQISEIPYADLPHIQVMGSKAQTFNIEAVFVGASSLAEANTLIKNLENTPKGELEHPWLGDLALVYQDHSLNISTQKGLVTLSLKFVRSGTSPSIYAPTRVRSKHKTQSIEQLAQQSLIESIDDLNVAQIQQIQKDASTTLNVLFDITDRLTLSDDILQPVHIMINSAISAVSRLSTNTAEFASLFRQAINAVAEAVQSAPDAIHEAIDYSRNAQALLLNQINTNSPVLHYNLQIMTGAVLMNKEMTTLELNDSFDITTTNNQPEIINNDLKVLIESLDQRVQEVTNIATQENIELYNALTALKSHIQAQKDKLLSGTQACKSLYAAHFTPALCLAHDSYSGHDIITRLNALRHPLFLGDNIAIREA